MSVVHQFASSPHAKFLYLYTYVCMEVCMLKKSMELLATVILLLIHEPSEFVGKAYFCKTYLYD